MPGPSYILLHSTLSTGTTQSYMHVTHSNVDSDIVNNRTWLLGQQHMPVTEQSDQTSYGTLLITLLTTTYAIIS